MERQFLNPYFNPQIWYYRQYLPFQYQNNGIYLPFHAVYQIPQTQAREQTIIPISQPNEVKQEEANHIQMIPVENTRLNIQKKANSRIKKKKFMPSLIRINISKPGDPNSTEIKLLKFYDPFKAPLCTINNNDIFKEEEQNPYSGSQNYDFGENKKEPSKLFPYFFSGNQKDQAIQEGDAQFLNPSKSNRILKQVSFSKRISTRSITKISQSDFNEQKNDLPFNEKEMKFQSGQTTIKKPSYQNRSAKQISSSLKNLQKAKRKVFLKKFQEKQSVEPVPQQSDQDYVVNPSQQYENLDIE